MGREDQLIVHSTLKKVKFSPSGKKQREGGNGRVRVKGIWRQWKKHDHPVKTISWNVSSSLGKCLLTPLAALWLALHNTEAITCNFWVQNYFYFNNLYNSKVGHLKNFI